MVQPSSLLAPAQTQAQLTSQHCGFWKPDEPPETRDVASQNPERGVEGQRLRRAEPQKLAGETYSYTDLDCLSFSLRLREPPAQKALRSKVLC